MTHPKTQEHAGARCDFMLLNGRCELGKGGGSPSSDFCSSCRMYRGTLRGLGDVVSNVSKATGIDRVVDAVAGGKDCGCGKRRAKLNKVLPFSPKERDS